jgi:amidase
MRDPVSVLTNGSIADISALYQDRGISIRDAVGWFANRIESYAQLNAVREISSCALDEAAVADEELARGRIRGPLHGIPVLLKDNVFARGMRASAGSLALADFEPREDAEVVKRLRAAGAIILGKTNMTEFADYVSYSMPAEFSAAGGVVRNPQGVRYGRGQGSSVGSAAAVAAGLAPFCIGSETQNSIQGPANYSSVVGYKPTVGAVSCAGIIPLAPSQDSPGPITRSVIDSALVAEVLTRRNARLIGETSSSRAPCTEVRQLRIGVPRRQIASRPEFAGTLSLLEFVISKLRGSGVTVVDPCDLPSVEQLYEARSSVFRAEFKASLNIVLEACGSPNGMRSLADIIRWNEANVAAIPYGQSLLLASEESEGINSKTYRADRAKDLVLSLDAGILAALKAHSVDYLIAPMDSAAKCTGKAGAPVLAIPAGIQKNNTPFGITLFGAPGCDKGLLAAGALIEKLLPGRKMPDLI